LVLDAPVRSKRPQRNPIVLAEEWQQRIVAGEVRSQADLARKLGVSRARVTQALTLLRLAVDVKDKVRALGDPLITRSVSEKALRGLVSFAVHEQREAIRRLLG
jgi:ParB-like chromosome segregation protein Spo0J